jgi:hypothetical protein
MIKKEAGQSAYDIGVDIAVEIGDDDLIEGIRELRNHESLQEARADTVFRELTSGFPDQLPEVDGIDPLLALANRIDSVIQENLDSDSIWHFLLLCGDHMQSLREIATHQVARTNLARSGAKARHATDPKQAAKSKVKECWEAWKRQPADYNGNADFALDMLRNYSDLKNQTVITRWCREWETQKT